MIESVFTAVVLMSIGVIYWTYKHERWLDSETEGLCLQAMEHLYRLHMVNKPGLTVQTIIATIETTMSFTVTYSRAGAALERLTDRKAVGRLMSYSKDESGVICYYRIPALHRRMTWL